MPRRRRPAGTEERRFTITDAGSATVRGVGDDVDLDLHRDPRPRADHRARQGAGGAAARLAAARLQDRGRLRRGRRAGDVRAQAVADGRAPRPPRPLYGAPNFTLVLPQARTRNGAGQTTKDLTEHPWAGVDVTMTLVARDEANNEGRSAPHEMRLPERPFAKPLPRALIEQRRDLALDADAKDRVLTALDALTIAPERFTPETNIYLGLRSIYWQLARAKNDDALRDVVARLWAMAVLLEDGNVSETEKALRAAQDALRQALERGATDEEIKKLMDRASRRARQVHAGAGRGDAQESADGAAARSATHAQAALAGSAEHARPHGAAGALRRQGCRQAAARRAAADAGEPADGAAGRRAGRRRRRHDVGARRARRHDPQAAAVARPHLPPGPGSAPPARSARPAGPAAASRATSNQIGELRQDQQALREQLNKLLEELRKRGFPQPGQRPARPAQGQQGGEMDQLGRAGEAMGDAAGPARRRQCRRRGRFAGPRARGAAQGRAGHGAVDAAADGPGPGTRPARPHGPARAPTRTPIRSAGRCAAATTATTPPSRCRARSTCSARAASSKSCAGASARASARSSSSTTSSGC